MKDAIEESFPIWNERAAHARTAEELQEAMLGFSSEIGFSRFSATVVIDKLEQPPFFGTLCNAPAGYAATFFDPALCRADPVMQHCKTSGIPIVWDQSTYTDRGFGALWDFQAQFGYKCGISLATHSPFGRHFIFGVDTDSLLYRHPNDVKFILTQVQLFAASAQAPAFKIFDSHTGSSLPRSVFSSLQLELLNQMMNGKTKSEIASALNINIETTRAEITHLLNELGCLTKYHAVLKALKLGLLISPSVD